MADACEAEMNKPTDGPCPCACHDTKKKGTIVHSTPCCGYTYIPRTEAMAMAKATRIAKREILLITADAVKDTGTVSFMFMIQADPERKLHPMPQKYGYVWRTNPGCYSFNVFEGGKGLYGGGWTGEDSNEWAQKMADALPSCTLLMDIDHLPWWKELAKKHGIVFGHHHFAGILKTSY